MHLKHTIRIQCRIQLLLHMNTHFYIELLHFDGDISLLAVHRNLIFDPRKTVRFTFLMMNVHLCIRKFQCYLRSFQGYIRYVDCCFTLYFHCYIRYFAATYLLLTTTYDMFSATCSKFRAAYDHLSCNLYSNHG